ncbi:MAG: universal stress protein [Candidatus Melainabacteria bacterium]|nr:universal stress protein [Candidatus Melainabacteria bacterium]
MKVLIAVDGSDCSNRAIESVAGRLWQEDDQFIVISVVEPIPADVGVGYFPVSSGGIFQQQYDDCANNCGTSGARLQTLLPGNQVEVRVVSGMVAETICNFAESWEADLIILGSHGRKGISHFLLGSVAEEVLKKSPCSVEVVKVKQKLHTEPKQSKKSQTAKA